MTNDDVFNAIVDNVVIRDDGCIVWRTLPPLGYAHIYIEKTQISVHRFMYEYFNGPIPRGLFVLHECDWPPCCNPDHLFLGTAKDNQQDRIQKGRHIRLFTEYPFYEERKIKRIFGDVMTEARIAAGLSKDILGRGLCATSKWIENIEQGRIPLTVATAANIAKATGVTFDYLIDETLRRYNKSLASIDTSQWIW